MITSQRTCVLDHVCGLQSLLLYAGFQIAAQMQTPNRKSASSLVFSLNS